MTVPYLIGTAVVVPSGAALHFSALVTDGVDSDTVTSSAALTAGTYSPTGFLEHAAKKLQAALFTAIGTATITGLTPPAGASDVVTELGIPEANKIPGVGLTLVELFLGETGYTGNGGVVVYTSLTLDNATTNDWALLGMARIGESRVVSAVAGDVTATGRFQPRWVTCLRASYDDFGDQEEFPGVFGEPMGDGSGFLHTFGRSTRYREIVLRDRPQAQCGPAYPVGIFGSFGATRNILNLQTQNEALLRGMTGTYSRTDNLSEHQYLRCGGWHARFYQVSGDSFVCYDVWPDSITPAAGEPIEVISEAHALLRQWLTVELLFPYEQIELTGVPSWIAKPYMPNQRGSWRMESRRRDNRNRLYSVTMSMFLVTNPGLATP